MGLVELFWILVGAAMVLWVLRLGMRAVRALEGIERSVARAVAQYERKSL